MKLQNYAQRRENIAKALWEYDGRQPENYAQWKLIGMMAEFDPLSGFAHRYLMMADAVMEVLDVEGFLKHCDEVLTLRCPSCKGRYTGADKHICTKEGT